MASRKKRSKHSGARELNASVKGLVDSITDAVFDRISARMVERDRVDDLEREIRQLAREVRKNARRFAEGRVGRPPSNRTCEVEGCERRHVAQGYCSRHYQAWRRTQEERAASRGRGRATRGSSRTKKSGATRKRR